MKWFLEVFLPSQEARMGRNPKYPNSCILSEKQAAICTRYMQQVYHKGDYGYFYTWELKTPDGKKFQMSVAGKWTFLNRY